MGGLRAILWIYMSFLGGLRAIFDRAQGFVCWIEVWGAARQATKNHSPVAAADKGQRRLYHAIGIELGVPCRFESSEGMTKYCIKTTKL